MIQVHQISFSYDELSVLEKVSFRVEKGEFVFLVGPSGAGKTTLLRLLYADLFALAGDLTVAGQPFTELNKINLPYFRQKIGIVFQDSKLLADKTVKENLALPQKLVGTAPRLLKDNVNELLHQMGLSHHQNAPSIRNIGQRTSQTCYRARHYQQAYITPCRCTDRRLRFTSFA